MKGMTEINDRLYEINYPRRFVEYNMCTSSGENPRNIQFKNIRKALGVKSKPRSHEHVVKNLCNILILTLDLKGPFLWA